MFVYISLIIIAIFNKEVFSMGLIKDIGIEKHNDYTVLNALTANGSAVRVGKVLFEKDARIPNNGYAAHEEDEYVCVLKGVIEFGTEEGYYNLAEGDFHYMPKGKNHWCKNMQDEDSELMFVLVS